MKKSIDLGLTISLSLIAILVAVVIYNSINYGVYSSPW